jgi:hypothetical protein
LITNEDAAVTANRNRVASANRRYSSGPVPRYRFSYPRWMATEATHSTGASRLNKM